MDEERLVRGCQKGNYRAFERLYQHYATRAVRTAYLLTRDHTIAEDAVQEAFLQVWRRIGDLRDPGAFRSWFYWILRHETQRQGRRERSVVPLPPGSQRLDPVDSTGPSPEEQALREEEFRAIREVLEGLPEQQRVLLILRYYSRLTDAEIAEIESIPIGTVKSRLHSARQAVALRLAAKEGSANG